MDRGTSAEAGIVRFVKSEDDSKRPVYVLGAGFSRAVSREMPLTDELGDEVKIRLRSLLADDNDSDSTFEDWLSLRVVRLPFLQGWENSRRLADAERIVAEIASVLDERVSRAAAGPCPEWLVQLVSLWHAERAVVITFNYDTLVEKAINWAQLVGFERDHAQVVFADQQVFPAPAAPPAVSYADQATPIGQSLQLLKLHGSLNWYWSAGDASGSTLVRARERTTFEAGRLIADTPDAIGAHTLDRFLIPPVSAKNEYYSPYLAHTLWRSAYEAIQATDRLTLIGYSLPKTDRIGAELLAGVPADATVEVVDPVPGTKDDPASLAARAGRLSPALTFWPGAECVRDYVDARVRTAASHLKAALDTQPSGDVMVALPIGRGLNATVSYFTVVDDRDGGLSVRDVDFNSIAQSVMPPREMSFNELPRGMNNLEDFLTVGRLSAYVDAGHTPQIRFNDRKFLATNASARKLGNWNVTFLSTVPLFAQT